MISIRTDGPMLWSVYAPNAYDHTREAKYFGPDTLEACCEAARVLHSIMPTPETPHGLQHDAPECEGHPAGEYDPMGETFYCDGSCVAARNR